MSFQMVRGDIVKMQVDAIVNAARESLLGGGGVDGAIHRAAGPGLLEECRTLGGCKPGQAKLTKGYRLPARYVIHTVGPVWYGGGQGEEAVLRSCYRTSLEVAVAAKCESVAFPLISAGAYGYPVGQAIQVAVDEIRTFLQSHEIAVTLVLFDVDAYRASGELYGLVQAYIDDQYAEERVDKEFERARWKAAHDKWSSAPRAACYGQRKVEEDDGVFLDAHPLPAARSVPKDILAQLGKLDIGFSRYLLKRIQASGMGEVECYTRANVDRRHFSKIRSQANYVPSKQTVCAFAIALCMDLGETEDLLRRAGFSLSPSLKFDLIIRYAIEHGIYDVQKVNNILFDFDQKLLGNSPS